MAEQEIPDDKITLPRKSLTTFIESIRNRGTPFDWDTWNCCHFVAEWVEYKTGEDYMPMLHTPNRAATREALNALGGSFESAVSIILRKQPVKPTLANVGDIMLVRTDDDVELLGICNGWTIFCLSLEGNLVDIKREQAVAAWHVD